MTLGRNIDSLSRNLLVGSSVRLMGKTSKLCYNVIELNQVREFSANFRQKFPLLTFCIKSTPKMSPNPLHEIISPERNNLSKFPQKKSVTYFLYQIDT